MRRALALAAMLTGCTPDPPDATDSGTEDTGDEPTTAADIPEPAFLSPAAGEFIVEATQTIPEPFVVQRIVPGNTQVLLDGASLGTFAPGNPFGDLTDDTLELRLQGGLVASTHALQLVNTSPDGPRSSVTLTMTITPPDANHRPSWRTELAATDLTGTALLATGLGTGRLLGLLTTGDPAPVLQLMRADETTGGWQTAEPITVPLDGHVPGDMSQAPAITAVAIPDPDGGPSKRMRVAFRVGLPGTAIAARDIVANPTPIVLNVFPAFDIAAALAGEQVEWAALGRPFALGHTLLAELVAAADTEVPHPGDRRIVASFWRGDDLQWTPPQRVGVPTPTDLDALGLAPVLPAIAGNAAAALSVRLGGAYPGLLEVRDDGAVAITTPTRTAPIGLSGELALTTLVSSFGGRTVAAVDTKGRIRLSLLSTSGPENGPRDASPPAEDRPDAVPTGAPAPGVVLGFSVFLIPYGDAAPVHLLVCDGQYAEIVALETPEPVHCDSVALAATLAGNDPEDPALAFACLSHGALQVGRLIADPPM